MMKICVLLSALVAFVAAKPTVVAPLVAPAPIVTASSSQYYHRNFNTVAAAYVAAPAPVVPAAPYIAAPSPYVAAASPYIAAPSPYVAAASPYIAAASPYVAAASPYIAAPAASYVAL